MIYEIKIDVNFLNRNFLVDRYLDPYRFGHISNNGKIFLHIRGEILSKHHKASWVASKLA